MTKFYKLFREKKGLTLVELVIGMVVLAIILATVSAILFPMMRFQARANELAEQNALLDNLANQIIYDISMATRRLESAPNAPIAPTPPATPHTLERGPDGGILIIPLPASVGGNITYSITNAGVIERGQAGLPPIPLLPADFQADLSVESIVITLTTNPTAGTVYTLTLTLSNDDNTLTFQRPYAVRPLALNNS